MRYLFLFLSIFLFNYTNSFCQNDDLKTTKKEANIDSIFQEKEYKRVVQVCTTLLYSNKKISKDNENKYISYLADSYLKLGDYNNAILWYKKIINGNKNDAEKVINNYLIISKIYISYEKEELYKSAIEELLEAKLIVNNKNLDDSYLWRIHNNLGLFYLFLNDLPNSKINLEKALKIALSLKDDEKTRITYLNKALLTYEGIGTSKENLEITKKSYLKVLEYSNKNYYKTYKNIGVVNYLQGNLEDALTYHNKALEDLTSVKLRTNTDLPKIGKIKKNHQKEVLLILYEKIYAWIKLSKQSKNKEHLNEALKTIYLADQILDTCFHQVNDEESQLYWKKKAASFYNLGATACFKLNLPEEAVYFIEKSKSNLLLDYTIENKLKKTLSENLLLKELKLKKEKDSFYNLTTSSNKQYLQDIFLKKKLELNQFTDSLKKEFPEVYKIKQSKNTYSLNQIKKQIKPNTTYLSFIWEKEENQFDALYGLVITKDTTAIYKIDGLNKMDSLVSAYISYLKKPLTTNEELQSFKKTSFNLYQSLFPDKEINKIIKKNTNLVIFPDSDLQSIPFESLVVKNNTTKYFIETHDIHYAYSMSYLIENSNMKRNATIDYVGYAPVSFSYENLNILPNTLEEVTKIKDEIGGKSYVQELATKQSFFKNSTSSKIIHLATHSNEIENPWISFKNNKLFLHELYTYKNQAELVYLNSCNSSLGEIKSGEGVYSLARGFFYSGANSVISSLWNVNDKSTQEITTSFYKYLKKGNSKSQALRHAKLEYLNTHSLSEVSPYYWSSLILIGDNSAINLKSNYLYHILLSISLIIFLFFILKKLKIVGNKS